VIAMTARWAALHLSLPSALATVAIVKRQGAALSGIPLLFVRHSPYGGDDDCSNGCADHRAGDVHPHPV
jgi:hypothetical protein